MTDPTNFAGIPIADVIRMASLPGGVILVLAWFFRAEIKVYLMSRSAIGRELAQMGKRLDDHIGKEEAYWDRSEKRITKLEDSQQLMEGRLITMTATIEGQNVSISAQMTAQGEKIAYLAQSVHDQSVTLRDLTQAILDHLARGAK